MQIISLARKSVVSLFNLFSVVFAFTCFVVILFAIRFFFVAPRELCKPAASGDQLIRRAFLEDLSGVEDDDVIGVLHHRVAVRDDHHRRLRSQLRECLLYFHFRRVITAIAASKAAFGVELTLSGSTSG